MIRASIITLSDKGSRGERVDESGPEAAAILRSIGAEIVSEDIIPDEFDIIKGMLVRRAEESDIIITTGGTGPAPRDVTPEATLAVIERPLPGISEAIRAEGLKKTARAMLTRGVAGIRGRCIIINLPGSPRAVRESLQAVLEILPHAVAKVRGSEEDCAG